MSTSCSWSVRRSAHSRQADAPAGCGSSSRWKPTSACSRVQGVRTTAGDVATRLVFNCAGAWSSSIGRMAGLEIPVLPYRRHIAVTGAFPAVPRNNPMTVDFQTSAYFHPEGDGVLIGMSDRLEAPGYVTDVKWEFLEKMLEHAARRAAALL